MISSKILNNGNRNNVFPVEGVIFGVLQKLFFNTLQDIEVVATQRLDYLLGLGRSYGGGHVKIPTNPFSHMTQ